MHSKIRFAFANLLFCGLALVISAPVCAGLVGNGTNTVSVNFWIPSSSVPPPACDGATNPSCENEFDSTDSASPTVPAAFVEGVLDGSTISVGDNKIVITNDLPNEPFCSTSLPCSDVFTGFAFYFSSGVDITDVTVASNSATDFRPISGGLTFTPTEIFVNVAGEDPSVGDNLILDVTTKTAVATPEASTWMLMLLGFAGLGFVGYRRGGGTAGHAR
jgi:hypothetical protein